VLDELLPRSTSVPTIDRNETTAFISVNWMLPTDAAAGDLLLFVGRQEDERVALNFGSEPLAASFKRYLNIELLKDQQMRGAITA
jgi:hypothetical protein